MCCSCAFFCRVLERSRMQKIKRLRVPWKSLWGLDSSYLHCLFISLFRFRKYRFSENGSRANSDNVANNRNEQIHRNNKTNLIFSFWFRFVFLCFGFFLFFFSFFLLSFLSPPPPPAGATKWRYTRHGMWTKAMQLPFRQVTCPIKRLTILRAYHVQIDILQAIWQVLCKPQGLV